jgi:hypothetical protein
MLLMRREAAAALGMSLRHSSATCSRTCAARTRGQLRLYLLRDLERWAEDEACREGRAA